MMYSSAGVCTKKNILKVFDKHYFDLMEIETCMCL